MQQPTRRWLRRLLEFSVFLGIVIAINAWSTRHTPDGPAPGFSATLLDGSPVQLASLQGRPVLLHFWATWCPICNLEQGSIDSISKDYQVLTIAVDDTDSSEITTYLDKAGVNYPVIHDRDYTLARTYGIRGVPTSFILDQGGNIRFAESGYTSETGLRLRLWWTRLRNGA